MAKTHQIYINDYETFDVVLGDDGEAKSVYLRRLVWTDARDHSGNAMMSERVRRAIEQAKLKSAIQHD